MSKERNKTEPAKPRILAVDDDPEVLDMVFDYFWIRGFELFIARDGGDAIEIAKFVQPDVILLDLKLRHIDGNKAIPHLREAAPRAKILIVSAYLDEDIRKEVLRLGAAAFFEKPISLFDLEKEVRAALEK